MPTYAYTCTECGHAFDIHQSFDDAALSVCPQCQGRLRKVFSPVGVVFKGSGFYRTDARASGKSSSGTTKETAGSGSGSSSSSGDSGSSAASSSTGGSSTGSSSTGSPSSSTAAASSSPSGAKAASA